jgi:ribosomal protein L20A (L18A)
MGRWAVSGSFLARRGDWQTFTKNCDADSAAQAQEWALSEVGGCHGVKRTLIRIASVSEVPA